MNITQYILPAAIALLGAWYLYLLRPVAKEDARRCALHELECFCPPNWGLITKKNALEALSRLYKELQYASRGTSFVITRAAAWEMKKIIMRTPKWKNQVNERDSTELYVWKTLIAVSLGNKHIFPLMQSFQKKYKGKLKNSIKHTKWVLSLYNKMNDQVITIPYEHLLNEFKEKLLSR
jgi:hypothetical protein